MIKSKDFCKTLLKYNLGPIVQVPCSYFKDLFNYLLDSEEIELINPANEAIAIGIASVYYLSTEKIPIVAIQNSGFLNTLNALTSLNQIYNIPLLYLISWRGQNIDAPEHLITGKNLLEILKIMGIPFKIIDPKKYTNQIRYLTKLALKYKKPVALIIKQNTFTPYSIQVNKINKLHPSRYEAICLIKDILKDNTLFISSTGYPSRDSFGVKDTPDFYMVGSMGHTLSVALGVSANTKKKVVVLDGDGSAIMHLSTLASYNPLKNKNLVYIILDNLIYESTGGQSTLSEKINYALLAKAFNFKNVCLVASKTSLVETLKKIKKTHQSFFVHIKISPGSNKNSPRVSDKYTCPEIKNLFIENIKV